MQTKFTSLKMADGRAALLIARHNGISISALDGRLKKGWSVDDAVTRPMNWSGQR